MTRLRHQWLPLTVLVVATGVLIASIGWASGSGWRVGPAGATMMAPGSMTGAAVAGDGPVRDLDGAEQAAGRFADRWGLAVGEVMQFDNGFYAELVDPAGDLATEVLVDPRTGGAQVEWGPAMMWNIAYGMHSSGARSDQVIGPDQARAIADQWLRDNRPAEHADEAEAFPGYYTLHTLRGAQIVGMLSVHATTGAVWHHSWHGRFIAMNKHPDAAPGTARTSPAAAPAWTPVASPRTCSPREPAAPHWTSWLTGPYGQTRS